MGWQMRQLLYSATWLGILIFGCLPSYIHSEVPIKKAERQNGLLSFLFVGDTSFGEKYQNEIENRGGMNVSRTKGNQYSIKNFSQILGQADLVIANLETPLTNLPFLSPLEGKKPAILWSDPSKTLDTFRKNNISVVSLANNHTLDYGIRGLEQTLNALRNYDIQWLGAGFDESAAARPLRFDYLLAGQPFQLVIAAGFGYWKSYDKKYDFYAKGGKAGTNVWTVARASEQIRSIRQKNPDAFIVAYPHWGLDYLWKSKNQTTLAHAIIDAGADLVLGHGPHLLQEIERYRSRWIIYSLGNFVFNLEMNYNDYQEKNMHPFSLLAKLDVKREKGATKLLLRLYPIFSDNIITNFQPRFVTHEQFRRVQEMILLQSPNGEFLQRRMGAGEDEFGRYLFLDITPSI